MTGMPSLSAESTRHAGAAARKQYRAAIAHHAGARATADSLAYGWAEHLAFRAYVSESNERVPACDHLAIRSWREGEDGYRCAFCNARMEGVA